MANREPRAFSRPGVSKIRAAIQSGVTAVFQPIETLRTGACRGFEALARLDCAGVSVAPDDFLSHLDDDGRLALFGTMLGQSIALMKSLGSAADGLYVSINVEISLAASEYFVDVLQYFLERYDFSGENLVLELLENEDIKDLVRLKSCLSAVKALGLQLAIDDVGAGYASMTRIRELPIDMFKLDRGFCLGLEQRPSELMFVISMLGLARGIGKPMIVEGIETPEVYDALRVLGVECGQGYGIARPMLAAEVASWIAGRVLRVPDPTPTCLLGAFASHLTVVEACRNLRHQPLPVAWLPEAVRDPLNCVIGHLFGARGWHDTPFGAAHRQFHGVLEHYAADPARWEAGAARFSSSMAVAIAADPRAMGCAAPKSRRARTPCRSHETPPTARRARLAARG